MSIKNETQTYLHPGRDYVIFREKPVLRMEVVSVINRNKDNRWLMECFVERNVL